MDRFSENNPGHTKQPTIYDRKKSRTPAVRIIKDSSKSKLGLFLNSTLQNYTVLITIVIGITS